MKYKIFAHRGYLSGNKNQSIIIENSISSLNNAYKNGFRAIEIDIFYHHNQFLLSHNFPQKNERYDKLSDLLAVYGNKLQYWFDFKNLNLQNSDLFISNLKSIIDDNEIELNNIYFAPFITDFKKASPIYAVIRKYFGKKAQILAVRERLLSKDYKNYSQKLRENELFGLSIKYTNINLAMLNCFAELRIFAWTVNDWKDAQNLDQLGIYAITSDVIKPIYP